VDLTRFQVVNKKAAQPVILFVGSFRHLPNLLAFEALRETILPLVRERVPDVQLHVVAGPEHERAAELAGRSHLLDPVPGIMIEGFVTDLRPIYQECDVVAIPLPVSAGTNIKLMEAMACGRAVVSTPVGCNGLGLRDGEDLLVRELGPKFADGLATLLENSLYRAEIAQNARFTAEECFGWDRIARHANESYSQLLRATCCEPIH
jgi:glycosyltransferase involved in cell wall biosynthesis